LTQDINTALEVLGVGMVTVFAILGLVVLSGHLLIKIVNTFFPATSIKSPLASANLATPTPSKPQDSKSTLAAIIATVDLVTEGKGKVSKIERIDSNK